MRTRVVFLSLCLTVFLGAGTAKAEAHLRPGRDGVLRPVHDIGLPLLAAPFVRVMYPIAEWLGRRLPREWMTRAKLNASLLLRHQISLLMAIVPAHGLCSMDRRLGWTSRTGTAPAWTLWFLRAQIGLVYFFGGIAKINGDWLRRSGFTSRLPRSSASPSRHRRLESWPCTQLLEACRQWPCSR